MSNDELVSDTIESVLVGMADSLRQAQDSLSLAPPLDQFGRVVPQYEIPYMDFEVGFKLVTQKTSTGKSQIFFKPVTSSSATQEITTKLQGRFVAVPPGEGLPVPILQIETRIIDPMTREISVLASNSANETLSGVEVEINFDKTGSESLAKSVGPRAAKFDNAVTISNALPITGENGVATTIVTLNKTLAQTAQVIITAMLGQEQISVIMSRSDS